MRMTLLDITQNILSRMSSDEVNSISDSTESLQVANIIKNKYFDIVNRIPLPEQEQLIQLDPSLDSTQPVLMFVPAGVASLKWLKYFNSSLIDLVPQGYQYVTILPVQQFIDMVNGFNTSETNVDTFTFTDAGNDYTFYYKDDRQPSFCTIISNGLIVFDSFNQAVDSTLQASKTMAWGSMNPTFELEDTFIPNLADEQFQLLVNEATALAFYELKQQPHQLAMQESKRGWTAVQKDKAVINRPTYFDELPNFGRTSRGFNSNISIFKARGFDR